MPYDVSAASYRFFAGAIVLGDSASAYCADRKWAFPRKELRAKLGVERGVNFHFEAWRGDPPVLFRPMQKMLHGGVVPTTGISYWWRGIRPGGGKRVATSFFDRFA